MDTPQNIPVKCSICNAEANYSSTFESYGKSFKTYGCNESHLQKAVENIIAAREANLAYESINKQCRRNLKSPVS